MGSPWSQDSFDERQPPDAGSEHRQGRTQVTSHTDTDSAGIPRGGGPGTTAVGD